MSIQKETIFDSKKNNDSGISSTISSPSTLTTKSEVKIPLARNSLRAHGAGRGIVWIAIMCWMLAGSLVSGDDLVIDSFQYASPAAAQAVWVRPYADASQLVIPVTEASVPCLSLPNIFTPTTARGAWDRTINLDLSAYSSIKVRLRIDTKTKSHFLLPGSLCSWHDGVVPLSKRIVVDHG